MAGQRRCSGRRRSGGSAGGAPSFQAIDQAQGHMVALLEDPAHPPEVYALDGTEAAPALAPERWLAGGRPARARRGHGRFTARTAPRSTAFSSSRPATRRADVPDDPPHPRRPAAAIRPCASASNGRCFAANGYVGRRGQPARQHRPRRGLRQGDLRRLGQEGRAPTCWRRSTTRSRAGSPIPTASASAAGAMAGCSPTTSSRSDQRFKAATSGAGIANMFAGYGTDQYITRVRDRARQAVGERRTCG